MNRLKNVSLRYKILGLTVVFVLSLGLIAIFAALESTANEKASGEEKVREAIREAELQRVYLTESVDQMITGMDRFAGGDLTVRLEVKNK